ncbi:MAG: rhomboid family intramembrane serine protease [Bacteroidetes bacterium]|nr:rhomboid family intramembrane serine protease [Bacteroidota bacterium]HET6244592.1 rhomboid family intramembrane serine protease [Bacteroidia bacterium]
MKEEKVRFVRSLFFPAFFVTLMWMVKTIEHLTEFSFMHLGIFPRTAKGLVGVLFSPFIHGDWMHLFNNSLPIIILGTVLFYFYRPIAYKVFFLIFFIANIWLWALGRPAYHIGASGIVYGLAAFVFFSGIIRWHIPLMVLSLLVTFLYGSLVWGIFPISHRVSFEGHLTGSIAGMILAYIYRKEGPQRKKYEWQQENDEEDDIPDDENAYWRKIQPEEHKNENNTSPGQSQGDVHYHYKPLE